MKQALALLSWLLEDTGESERAHQLVPLLTEAATACASSTQHAMSALLPHFSQSRSLVDSDHQLMDKLRAGNVSPGTDVAFAADALLPPELLQLRLRGSVVVSARQASSLFTGAHEQASERIGGAWSKLDYYFRLPVWPLLPSGDSVTSIHAQCALAMHLLTCLPQTKHSASDCKMHARLT